ncbi:DUF4082 domain-containing protein [Nonomuraea lactucae]|uniref:DUF4082 domain-containing protein n=1 Tax=Nonomuraea lactucae TaxID=2249762 RepID=UPI0013B37543|nr:DUF4082 domain-containing protein [Nonomuraea lactucae]
MLATLLAAGALVTGSGGVQAAQPIDLGDAEPFAVLAETSVSNTNLTTVTGNLGISPGSTLTGFPPGIVNGTRHLGNATAAAAKADADGVYTYLSGLTGTATVAPQLGGTTRGPGVYTSTTGSFAINGTLTLDAQGDPDAVFVFRASSLTVAQVGNVNLVRGAQQDNIFWQLSGATSIGMWATFRGNVVAQGGVSVAWGAFVDGRLFSLDDSITITGTDGTPHTRISLPDDPPTTTTLTTSPDPSWKGEPITLTATVEPVSGSVVPFGEVVFKDGDTVLGSAFHSSEGPAVFTATTLPGGDRQLTAVYLGGDTFDGEELIHFAPSVSPPVTHTVEDSLWNEQVTPAVQSQPDTQAVTVGVKFRAAQKGTISGVRFFKGAQNTGTHVGSLWSAGGSLLASATFTGETASGWQEVTFSTPVEISANTTYVASYHTTSGRYSVNRPYFTSSFANGPLTALANGTDGGNGVYSYGASNSFPDNSYQASNYWVDVVFQPSDSLWNKAASPAVPSSSDDQAVTVGVKFQSSVSGQVYGVRFFKGALNTGAHVASLWSGSGELLASTPFVSETASGWQEVNFPTPVTINANTTYVAAYHTTSGNYSITRPYFTSAYTNSPLTALAHATSGGNGVFAYGASSSFPTSSFQATNYWVDVIFRQ